MNKNIFVLPLLIGLTIPVMAQEDITEAEGKVGNRFTEQTIDVGTDKEFKLTESTASVSVIQNKDLNHRSAKSIGWDMMGQGLGLFSTEGQGIYGSASASFTVRGLQSLETNDCLILVDGIARSISNITPEEVESISVLKDAAATALYGHLGANGAILITTKRGKYNSSEMKFTYDHVYGYLLDKPKFVDAYTYALATNEALANEGSDAMYTDDELNAFKNQTYPYYYPNINWMNETFRNHDVSNRYVIEFTGGTQRFRYYTMVNLLTNKGFVKNPNENDGYSTQDKYVRGNVRTNLEVEVTPTTKLRANLTGVLSEQNRPGDGTSLWSLIYKIPASAYPIINENGTWGGSSSWSGESNPVAMAQGAGYYKNHTRGLMSDISLTQDLSGFVDGLSVTGRIAYDHTSTLYEDHSKSFAYGMTSVSWVDGAVDESTATTYSDGEEGTLGSSAATSSFSRHFEFNGGFLYDKNFGKHDLYSQLKWHYEFNDSYSTNSTIYRQNFSWFTHYGFNKKYYVDLALVAAASNKLAPGHKWTFSPTISAAWIISNEKFMEDQNWINFLKLRASYGLLHRDVQPNDDNAWLYYQQGYSLSSSSYYYTSSYTGTSSTVISRMVTENPSNEKAHKYNIGIDATLFGGLNITLDAHYQQRRGIWVETSGKYSAVVGLNAPYESVGKVDSWGWELGLDYNKTWGDFALNVGAQVAYHRNQIKYQAEAPRLYDNLVQTGHQVDQIYGLKAIGLLTAEDIENMSLDSDDANYVPTQSYGTVYAGDIKYEDVNGDGTIDDNDKVAIGHATTPQLYYNLKLGAEWKGLGFFALLQGAGRYSTTLNTSGMYWPLLSKTNLSQYAYDNRWTEDNPNAAMPRLSTTSNANNYQTSTWWVKDRSFIKLRTVEVYYHLPKSLLAKTKYVDAAKIYLRGNNLLGWDHIPAGNAEGFSAAQPMTRNFAMGLQVTF
ncbi:MAG: SusC/RagA family TonB-linked outer membrane protein [Bacteroides sp.]|nr:SusC/RagA family TonB-linked outer membrane protein [Bacteroides sp.]